MTGNMGANALHIVVLSNRADLVSGGEALVEVLVPANVALGDVRIGLNGTDVTKLFAPRPNRRFQGVVTGLRLGANELTAETPGGGARLVVTNHPSHGPVISGPQVEPYICETELYGLDPATGPEGAVPTRYDFFYRSTGANAFKTYDPDNPPPDRDIAQTTTDQGVTVPYVVRRERGTVNRGVYDIAVLFQPGEDWEPWAPQRAWNGKLHMIFEGGFKPWHRQGRVDGTGTPGPAIPDVLEHRLLPGYTYLGDLPLSRGWAVATSSLTQANAVLAAESAIMVKELFIRSYGPARYTTSIGESGGSMAQHYIANMYPGVLDGIMPCASTPDIWTTMIHDFFECSVLHHYFTEISPDLWTDPAQRGAVDGTKDGRLCEFLGRRNGGGAPFDPRTTVTTFDQGDEPDWVYDPDTNPSGARGTLQDWQAQVLGRRENDGFANGLFDNVGIQYGLIALLRRQITTEQFVDLNTKVGGRDIDYNWTPHRIEADVEGVRNLYRSGLINDARRLDRVPIMDLRFSGTNDWDIHASIHTQMTRARMIAANGHADNQVRWSTPDPNAVLKRTGRPFVPERGNVPITEPMVASASVAAMCASAFLSLDKWLTAIDADTSNDPIETKVLRHKPAEAIDTCWKDGKPGAGDSVPNYWVPRMMAGAPIASTIFKGQLKPVDWADYAPIEFTDEQKQRLLDVFPHGVCDWTRPGVEQQPSAGVWQTFAETIGGHPLGPEPYSTPI